MTPEKKSYANRYDVDAIIDVIGYCKFNLVPFFFIVFNMVITVSNVMVVTYSVWIPPNYIDIVCGGGGGDGGGGGGNLRYMGFV